jgi:hypothetical protein
MRAKVLFCLIINLSFYNSIFFAQSNLIWPKLYTNTANQKLNLQKHWLNNPALTQPTKESKTNSTLDSIYMITLGGSLSKVLFFYNEPNKLSSYIYSSWDGNKWIIYWRVTNSYNTEGKIKTYLYEFLSNGIWEPLTRQSFNYNSLGQEISYLFENWNGTQWINSSKSTQKYDTKGNLIEDVVEEWIDTSWIYSSRIVSTFSENRILASLLVETWDINTWKTSNLVNYEYDDKWNLIKSTLKEWSGSDWLNIARSLFCYDLDYNRTDQITETWVDSTWIYSDRIFNEYNENNCIVYSKYFIWDKGVWQSAAIGPIVFTLEEGTTMGFITSEINFFYNKPTNVLSEKIEAVNNYSLSQNYPNPFNPTTKIRYQIPLAEFVTLKVFDILGNEVATLVKEFKQPGNYEAEFNTRRGEVTSPLPSGIYFYQLKAGNYVESKKLVLMK